VNQELRLAIGPNCSVLEALHRLYTSNNNTGLALRRFVAALCRGCPQPWPSLNCWLCCCVYGLHTLRRYQNALYLTDPEPPP